MSGPISSQPSVEGWLDRTNADGHSPWAGVEPIGDELLGVERLEQYACNLAAEQPLLASPEHGKAPAARMRRNTRALRRSYESIVGSASTRRSVTPAAEWFVDNYHVVERQLQLIRDDLPAAYYRQLPKPAAGPPSGFPRITGIAWAFVAHSDSHLDTKLLPRFVQEYQRIESLRIGELRALASMLAWCSSRISDAGPTVSSRTARSARWRTDSPTGSLGLPCAGPSPSRKYCTHTSARWGVTEFGLGWTLAEFSSREDALDYARAVAVSGDGSVIEGEDGDGRLTLREASSTDAGGLIRITSSAL